MKPICTIILIFLFAEVKAQQSNNYTPEDAIMMQIPDSLTYTTDGIVRYINTKFSNQSDKCRATYIWIVQNIQYDIENMYAINWHQTIQNTTYKTLITRKGICLDYANLFCEILYKLGIKTYPISGYTKNRGFVEHIPHVWCTALIDNQWMLFDPTWGSGKIRRSKFIKEVNINYYKVAPKQLIKTHMPFDPLWQMLDHPVTSAEFYKSKILTDKSRSFFNYKDSIKLYDQESDIDRLFSSCRRIEQNGINNYLTYDILFYNKQEIENSIINLYNEGIIHLNKFIQYRNKKFTPTKSEREIKQMIATPDSIFVLAMAQLKMVNDLETILGISLAKTKTLIETGMSNLNEEKLFLDLYFKTEEENRKILFYK